MDELNSVLGTVAAVLRQETSQLLEEIHRIQSNLLHIGAWLATTSASPNLKMLEKISETQSRSLEDAIDRMQVELPELHGFILPGGHPASAWAHVARTVCRRTERHVVFLYEQEENQNARLQFRQIILYLNRLSDYLFVFARYCNHLFGEQDIIWKHEEA